MLKRIYVAGYDELLTIRSKLKIIETIKAVRYGNRIGTGLNLYKEEMIKTYISRNIRFTLEIQFIQYGRFFVIRIHFQVSPYLAKCTIRIGFGPGGKQLLVFIKAWFFQPPARNFFSRIKQ